MSARATEKIAKRTTEPQRIIRDIGSIDIAQLFTVTVAQRDVIAHRQRVRVIAIDPAGLDTHSVR